MSIITATRPQTIEDLERFDGKAELIQGRIVERLASGFRPNRVAFLICKILDEVAREVGQGWAFTDNAGFRIRRLPSGRESFSPDAAYYVGPLPQNEMKFIPGPPTLAVEVRSENDYGSAAEDEMADKRTDYFQAGTQVVWDVDLKTNMIHVYRSSAPESPTSYGLGERVEAEPVLPGWSVPVVDILG